MRVSPGHVHVAGIDSGVIRLHNCKCSDVKASFTSCNMILLVRGRRVVHTRLGVCSQGVDVICLGWGGVTRLSEAFARRLFARMLRSAPYVVMCSRRTFRYDGGCLGSAARATGRVFRSVLNIRRYGVVCGKGGGGSFQGCRFVVRRLGLSVCIAPERGLARFSLDCVSSRRFVIPASSSRCGDVGLGFVTRRCVGRGLVSFLSHGSLVASCHRVGSFYADLLSLGRPVERVGERRSQGV